jgi:hypothetical protein
LISEAQTQHFDEWSLPPSGPIDSPVEQVAWRSLGERENAIGVWEDAQMSAGDSWVKNHPDEPLAFIGDEVYSSVSEQNLTQETFNGAMGSMVAWWGSPAVLATPTTEALTPLLQHRPSLTPAHLEPLATSLHMLFFSAYDDVAYICWTPNSLDL